MARAPKRRSAPRKILHGIKKFGKRHHVMRKIKKYGPGVAATGVALAGIAAAAYLHKPAEKGPHMQEYEHAIATEDPKFQQPRPPHDHTRPAILAELAPKPVTPKPTSPHHFWSMGGMGTNMGNVPPPAYVEGGRDKFGHPNWASKRRK